MFSPSTILPRLPLRTPLFAPSTPAMPWPLSSLLISSSWLPLDLLLLRPVLLVLVPLQLRTPPTPSLLLYPSGFPRTSSSLSALISALLPRLSLVAVVWRTRRTLTSSSFLLLIPSVLPSVLLELPLTLALLTTPSRSVKPVRSSPPISTLPSVFLVPFSTWLVWRILRPLLLSTRTLRLPSSRFLTLVLSMTCSPLSPNSPSNSKSKKNTTTKKKVWIWVSCFTFLFFPLATWLVNDFHPFFLFFFRLHH